MGFLLTPTQGRKATGQGTKAATHSVSAFNYESYFSSMVKSPRPPSSNGQEPQVAKTLPDAEHPDYIAGIISEGEAFSSLAVTIFLSQHQTNHRRRRRCRQCAGRYRQDHEKARYSRVNHKKDRSSLETSNLSRLGAEPSKFRLDMMS